MNARKIERSAGQYLRLVFAGAVVALLAACGGSSGSAPQTAEKQPHKIGGAVAGLAGSGLVLQNNAGDDIAVVASGTFTFATSIDAGETYHVSVKNQPTSPSQVCTVNKGSGIVGDSNVNDVAVVCAAQSYAVGGSVSGLQGAGLMLQNNGGDDLSVAANGNFTFPASVAGGAGYAVTVKTQPGSPEQTCTVTSGTGLMNGAHVSNVAVTCSTKSYYVKGTVSGLNNSLTLQNNGGTPIVVSGNAPFFFPAQVASGATYAVTVQIQPTVPPQVCAVTNGTGVMGAADVTDVVVNCSTQAFSVGGSIASLKGSGLVFQINGGDDLAVPAEATSFVFNTPIVTGNAFTVTVKTQPKAIDQVCTVSNGTGVVSSAPVNSVVVSCASMPAKLALMGMQAMGTSPLPGVHPHPISNPGEVASAYAPYGVTNLAVGSVVVDPANKWVYSLDDDSIDQFTIGNPIQAGLLFESAKPVGTAHVALVMDPLGRFLYALNITKSTVQLFQINATTGNLSSGAVFPSNGIRPRDGVIDPTGRYLYVINEDTNQVANWHIQSDGELLPGNVVSVGQQPSSIVMDPTGKFLYVGGNQSSYLSVIPVDAATGILKTVVPVSMDKPFRLAMHPGGKFLFVADSQPYGVAPIKSYRLDPSTGLPTSVATVATAASGRVFTLQADPSGDFLYSLSYGMLETYQISASGIPTTYRAAITFGSDMPLTMTLSR